MASSDDQGNTPASAGGTPLINAKPSRPRVGIRSWRILGPGDGDARISTGNDGGGGGRRQFKLGKFKLAAAFMLVLTSAPAGDGRADGAASAVGPATQWEVSALARRGSADAQYALALRLARDPNAGAGHDQTHWWLRQAARGGHPGAQNDLGVMYGNGYARSRDNVDAYMWFEIAAGNGNAAAARNRNALRDRMTDAEVEAGLALAHDWLRWHTA